MREVIVRSDATKLGQDIAIGELRLRADHEAADGGNDTGGAPHELLLAALGACTSMTLRSYAEHKGWPLRSVAVTLSGEKADGKYVITRKLQMEGDLDAGQRQRLLEIAEKCPVHRTLTGEVVVQTTEVPA
jgi:putative redox protein